MNCIVTAGPAFEPLDDVRRLTNFSTGRLGTELANYLAARGHNVLLLLGEQATYAGERRAQRIESFSTTADLRAKLKSLAAKKVDAIFHSAAVSDFAFGRIFAPDAANKLVEIKSAKKISDSAGEIACRIAADAENHRGIARLVSADAHRRLEIRGGRQARGRCRRRTPTTCGVRDRFVRGERPGLRRGIWVARQKGRAGAFAESTVAVRRAGQICQQIVGADVRRP